MDQRQTSDEDRTLSVRLEVQLDRQPINGRLSSERGAVEPFVGWLGFVEALTRLNESREGSTGAAGGRGTGDPATTSMRRARNT